MMKKEKLEQMRELGRGGLSKGLTMLRNAAEKAAANTANAPNAPQGVAAIGPSSSALDDGSGDAAGGSTSSSAAASGGGTSKLTYDELVTLSVKLTRQNKMMKAQFQKMQVRISQLSGKEADAQVLSEFVANVVGVDLDACRLDESKASAESGDEDSTIPAAATTTIDAKELKERYVILQELNEREHKRIEERLRAELSALRSSQHSAPAASSDGLESVSLLSFSPVAAAPPPVIPNYDEIDLLGDPMPSPPTVVPQSDLADFETLTSSANPESVAMLEKQLEDAMAQLHRMQEQVRAGSLENEELHQKFNDVWTQRTEQVDALTTEKQGLEQSVAELKRAIDAHEATALERQKRWSEQSHHFAKIQEELQEKIEAETRLFAENTAIQSKLDELSCLLAESKQTVSEEPDTASLQTQVLELHEEISSMQQSLSAAQADLSLTQDEKQALMDRVKELSAASSSKMEEIEKLRAELAFVQEENAALSERIAQSVSNEAASADTSVKTDADSEILSFKEEIASLTLELSAKEDKLSELESSLAIARSENEKLLESKRAISVEESTFSGEHHSDGGDRAEQAAGLLNQEIAALLGELEKVKMERAETDHTVRTLKGMFIVVVVCVFGGAFAYRVCGFCSDKLRAAEAEQKTAQAEIERSDSLVEALKENTSRLADELESHKREKDESVRKLTNLQEEFTSVLASKESLEEELGVLRRDTHANLESTLTEVEANKKKVESVELEKTQLERRMAEEREYLESKIETLIKELDIVNKKNEELQSGVEEKEKQVHKMALSQTSMTKEMMDLQTQLSSMRQDLHMAAEGLEAHATRAEQSDLKRQEIEGKMANMKLQMESMRDEHRNDFEMLRQEREGELERVKQDRSSIARKLSDLDSVRNELQAKYASLDTAYHEEQRRVAELEAKLSQQTTEIGNLSVDLAETKKALSDRMGLATRLQTENMGIAAKQAEQAALIENALREAAASKDRAHEMESKMQDAKQEMERVKRIKEDTVAEMKRMKQEMDQQQQAIEAEQEQSAIQFQALVDAEKEAFKRDVERIEAESKLKSKRALQVVLEKEAEIERLSKRLNELEEDVRSGDADNRKIFEFAQLQAKREAESRAQAMQLQEMTDQLQEAYRHIQRLQEEKQNHDHELTALMQTQRREGVNMEYLKNVVVQYMSFRPGSSQQARLVPVLSTLLQFSAGDMREIKNASNARRSSWTSWGSETKDYKPILDGKGQRHSTIPPSPAGSGTTTGSLSDSMPPRASSFTLPHAMESASSSDPSAFASHSASERADF